jgi:hypothetical protein
MPAYSTRTAPLPNGRRAPAEESAAPVEEPKSIRLIEDRWTVIRHAVEAIAIVAAGIWAFYVFIYQESIKPAFEAPSLQLTATFDPGSVVSGVRVAQLHVNFENTGHVDSDVYAEAIDVYGDRFDLGARSRSRVPPYPGQIVADRRVPTKPPELVYAYSQLRDGAFGGKLDEHIMLTPGEHITLSFPIAVREGRFDELNADLAVAYGRFRPYRHAFANVKIVRRKSGGVSLVAPQTGRDDEADEVDFSLQATL